MNEENDLVGWIVSKLDEWKEYRDNNYKEKWNEYYRLWRGVWKAEDSTRSSERSRLISPALQQAIEAQVSEMEEAVFGKGKWFDIADDYVDQEKQDALFVRGLLTEDLELAKTKDAIAETIFNAALYGTGIAEIVPEKKSEKVLVELPVEGTNATTRDVVTTDAIIFKTRPIMPDRFLIDPVATHIDEALGCAIEDYVSYHKIEEGIKKGQYKDIDVGTMSKAEDVFAKGETTYNLRDKVKLTTYYGLIPQKFIATEEEDDYQELFPNEDIGESEELVEAIVIIANDSEVLSVMENPYFGKDRPVIAYQHDRVPGRFWGRGVAEKGYNPQKALDAELRARMDALALSTHPMMGIDATRLPRGMKFEVSPGRSILTNGNPHEILAPIQFQSVAPQNFQQSADLERLVQVGTGSIDTAAPLGSNPRNNTAGGMSMMVSASIKRQKRTLMNFNENFLSPLIMKVLWRYIQYDPKRYPIKDYKFIPLTNMGIMAREYEQQQFVQLLSVTPKDSPMFAIIAEGIINNSSLQNREELLAKMAQAQKPDPRQQQMQEQMHKLQMEKIAAEAAYLRGQLEGIKVKAQMDAIEIAAKQLDMKQEKDNSGELELKAKVATVDAQQKQQEILLKETKQNQDYDLGLKEIALRLEELTLEKEKIARENMKEDSTQVDLTEIRGLVSDLQRYISAKKKPIRDAEGNLIGVEVEGFGTKPISLDDSGNITEIA